MTATVKAHGMEGNLEEPDWPPLTLAELRPLFRQFPSLGEPAEILTVSPRPLSAASIVRAAGGRVFVKRHHRSVRDGQGLREEHRFMTYLRRAGANVPRVFVSSSGNTATELGDWTYEVHEVPSGIDLYGDAISWTPFHTTAHAHAAGRAMAQLHRAARGFAAPLRKPQPLVASFTIFAAADPVAALEHYLAARPTLAASPAVHARCEEALQLLMPFHARLAPLLPSLEPLWTHNDLHCSNLLWSGASPDATVAAAIDFGLSDRTNAVHDIANAIERNVVEWLQLVADPAHPDKVTVHFDHLQSLLDGYASVRRLSAEESAALAPMTALCHAEFALSEAEYFLAALHDEAKAALAYDGWLVGHTRWFYSSAGEALLAAIERRAAEKVETK